MNHTICSVSDFLDAKNLTPNPFPRGKGNRNVGSNLFHREKGNNREEGEPDLFDREQSSALRATLRLILGAGVTPAEGSVKPTAGFTYDCSYIPI